MKTTLEALFQAMMSEGWACGSTGDVESPAGYFAWMTNTPAELASIRDAFAETIKVYGDPGDAEMTGHFLVIEDSQGFVTVIRYTSEPGVRAAYDAHQDRYHEWFNAQPLQDA